VDPPAAHAAEHPADGRQASEAEEDFRYPTLILVLADKRLALMVEDIIGREEIV